MDVLLTYQAIACERELERERAHLIARARSAIALERATKRVVVQAAASRTTARRTPPAATRAGTESRRIT